MRRSWPHDGDYFSSTHLESHQNSNFNNISGEKCVTALSNARSSDIDSIEKYHSRKAGLLPVAKTRRFLRILNLTELNH